MNSLTPTQTPPGDREAAQNATRRAERRGTTAAQVDAAAVRLALADAISMNHFKQLLKLEGIEAEFDRRGQAQAVYGWRLRRRGSEEWLKASTLARDLSWPKISHRFMETDSAEELPTNDAANAAQSVHAPKAPDEPNKYDRAPAMLRQSLVRQSKPGVLDFDLATARKNIWADEVLAGPAKVILEIGFIAMKLGAEALKALIQLVQWILRKMGFGTAAAPAGSDQAKTPLPFLPVIDVDSRFLPEPDNLKIRSDEATAELQKVAAALVNNDVDLLPQGEGRAELAAALTAERTPFSVPSAADTAGDFLGGSENKQQTVDAALEVTTAELVDQFKSEVSEHQAAMAALKTATAPDLASLPFFVSQNKRAGEESEVASVEADSAEKEYLDWKAKNRLMSALVDPFGLKKRAEEAREIAKKYAIALTKSQAEDAAFSRRVASLPPRAAPPEIVAATTATGERGRQTWAFLKARIRDEILAAKAADPMLGARLDVLMAKLDRTRPAGLADPVKSVTFFKEFDSLRLEYSSAKAASFVLNQRVDSEFDEQVEKPSAPK